MSAVRTQSFPVPILLTPQKAADLLGVGRTSLLALLKAKKLKAKKIGDRYYFVTASLVEYEAGLPDA